jgi:hypothetical protein
LARKSLRIKTSSAPPAGRIPGAIGIRESGGIDGSSVRDGMAGRVVEVFSIEFLLPDSRVPHEAGR